LLTAVEAESPVSLGYTWPWRANVALCLALLSIAVFLVRAVRFSRWRSTLGSLAESPPPRASHEPDPAARMLAAVVERAADRLPFATKCLPRAVALQWRLRLAGIPSDLVVAFHAIDRSGEDRFHAWVEHAGEMVIGQCDRTLYRPVMILSQGRPAAVAGRA
jgi:hypothetical protein